jgi:hypothetical protein
MFRTHSHESREEREELPIKFTRPTGSKGENLLTNGGVLAIMSLLVVLQDWVQGVVQAHLKHNNLRMP